MLARSRLQRWAQNIGLASAVLLLACGDGSNTLSPASPQNPADPPDPTEPAPEACQDFASTFEAIQETIFEKRQCTNETCHGSSSAGGLDLRPAVAYENLIEVPATGADGIRVVPGDRERSLLYAKLEAATRPGSVEIAGAPMPVGSDPLTENELEAVRIWISGAAPRDGNVDGTAALLDACLPEAEPVTILPLSPPDPEVGVQFVMPEVELGAGQEQELCFATFYDFTGRIPERFLDPTGNYFRIRAQELRQDPNSHHLVLSHSGVPREDIDHPAFPAWTCAGGDNSGQVCNPLDPTSCGTGFCRTEPVDSFACISGALPGSLRPGSGVGDRVLEHALLQLDGA